MATRGLSWQLLSQRRIRPLSPRPLTRRHFFGAISVTGATTEGCETSDQVLRLPYCCQPRFQSIGQHHQNRFSLLPSLGLEDLGQVVYQYVLGCPSSAVFCKFVSNRMITQQADFMARHLFARLHQLRQLNNYTSWSNCSSSDVFSKKSLLN